MKKINIKATTIAIDLLNEYVIYKRNQGFKFHKGDKRLAERIINYLFFKNPNNPYEFSKEIVDEFCFAEGAAPRTIHARQSSFRQLAIFLNNFKNGNGFIYNTLIKCKNDYVPYIYSENEIKRILLALDKINYSKNSWRNYKYVISAIIRVIYCCGLRSGEAKNLRISDVNLIDGNITIKSSKNNVTRKIPISNSLRKYLIDYRSKLLNVNNPYFFPSSQENKSITMSSILFYFKKASKEAGINGFDTNGNVKLHCLRHTFAVHSLEKMIKEGMDPFCSLPYLSIYMGHRGIESTEYYLRLTKDYFQKVLDYSKDDMNRLFPEVSQ